MSVRLLLRFALAMLGVAGVAPTLAAATLSDWAESFGVAYQFRSAGIPVKSYFAASARMLPTLAEGDVVLTDLGQAGVQPLRGELIVSRFDDKFVMIDRVIGLPGDRVGLRAGHVILNGNDIAQEPAGTLEYDASGKHQIRNLFVESFPGARPYKIAREADGNPRHDDIPETVVAPGYLYLLGDNRDNALDSRFQSRGQVKIEAVVGRVVYRMRPNAGWLVPRETVPQLPKE
ncbi:signal peptidase I [Rhizobiales bacterium GAS191]|nr:signal peptidase I [Rhizobiales bacterium GAS191]